MVFIYQREGGLTECALASSTAAIRCCLVTPTDATTASADATATRSDPTAASADATNGQRRRAQSTDPTTASPDATTGSASTNTAQCYASICTADPDGNQATATGTSTGPSTPLTGTFSGAEVSLYVAARECAAHGARLCTAGELQAGACSGADCEYDQRYVWSSSTCTSPPSIPPPSAPSCAQGSFWEGSECELCRTLSGECESCVCDDFNAETEARCKSGCLGTWSTISTAGATGNSGHYFRGAASIGTVVYFAPCNDNSVGVLDTVTSAFAAVPTDLTNEWKYDGAAVVGTKVYFGPSNEDNIGVLDSVTSTFSTIATTGVTGDQKYGGAVAVSTTVYFVPGSSDTVGALNTATDTFSTYATTVSGATKYSGGAVVGTVVYFGPRNHSSVGRFDTATSSFSTVSASSTDANKYCGAAVIGTKVYFGPRDANNIGVFDTSTSEFFTHDFDASTEKNKVLPPVEPTMTALAPLVSCLHPRQLLAPSSFAARGASCSNAAHSLSAHYLDLLV